MPLYILTRATYSGHTGDDPPHEAMLVEAEDVSDDYHTMSELYEHRYALLCALVKAYDDMVTPLGPTSIYCWKSRVHNDGTMFEGHFIVGITKKLIDMKEKTITYHLPLSWWGKFNCIELITGLPWDGHKSKDVVERLLKL